MYGLQKDFSECFAGIPKKLNQSLSKYFYVRVNFISFFCVTTGAAACKFFNDMSLF